MNGTQGFKTLFKHLKLLKESKRITIKLHGTSLDTGPCRYNRSRGLFVPAAGGPDHIDPPWPASPAMCYITDKGVNPVSQ